MNGLLGNLEIPLHQIRRILKIVWFALIAGAVFYTVLAKIAVSSETADPDNALKYAIYAMAFVSAALSILMKRLIINRAVSSPEINRDQNRIAKTFMAANLVSFGLCESIAVYGFVIYFFGGQQTDLYVLCGFSIVCFIVNYPNFQQLENLLQRAQSSA